MLRRLKREVMAELPRKRRQVVRLPCPTSEDWAAAGGAGACPAVHDLQVLLRVCSGLSAVCKLRASCKPVHMQAALALATQLHSSQVASSCAGKLGGKDDGASDDDLAAAEDAGTSLPEEQLSAPHK